MFLFYCVLSIFCFVCLLKWTLSLIIKVDDEDENPVAFRNMQAIMLLSIPTILCAAPMAIRDGGDDGGHYRYPHQ